ncbi:lactadherin-like [Antedon mediterranea]|uniref:lactadherin-like n=1 Tax=Antedon mediterranea TaxID=105859 RepID=UPI003AF43757
MSHEVDKAEGICASVDCGSENICINVPGALRRHLCFCSGTGYLVEQCPSPECLEPLGIESGNIFDGQLSASSMHGNSADHGPKCARLNSLGTSSCMPCWVALSSDTNTWIQIHLMVEHNITGIQTQGRGGTLNQWVKTYTISYIKVNQGGEHFISDGHGHPKVSTWYNNFET